MLVVFWSTRVIPVSMRHVRGVDQVVRLGMMLIVSTAGALDPLALRVSCVPAHVVVFGMGVRTRILCCGRMTGSFETGYGTFGP